MCTYSTCRISANGGGREFRDHGMAEVNGRQGRKGDGNGCNSVYKAS